MVELQFFCFVFVFVVVFCEEVVREKQCRREWRSLLCTDKWVSLISGYHFIFANFQTFKAEWSIYLSINNTTCFHISNNCFLSTEDIAVFLLTLTIIPTNLPVQHYSVGVVHILGVFFEVEIHSSNNVRGIRRFASSYVTLLFFMKMYYLTHWVDSKVHHNSSSLQLTADVCVSRHSLIKTLWPSSPRHQFIDNEMKGISNMIYIKLRSVNLSAAVGNKRNHVVKGLVDDLV